MILEGYIENGVVVFDEEACLPNGTRVRVEPVTAAKEIERYPEAVHADTDQALSVQQMAEAWRAISKPVRNDNVSLSVDPDDFPLF